MPVKEEIIHVEKISILTKAKNDLSNIWGPAIITFIVYMLISMVGGVIPMGSLVLAGPLSVGLSIYSLKIAKGEESKLDNIFEGFNNFGIAIGTYVLMVIFVLLWMLLFIIPGIIAAINYSQSFYIIAEDKEKKLSPMDALNKSKEMMKGHKMDYFILGFKLFIFFLLSLFTFGIALLWLMPYSQVAMANFYLRINPEKHKTELDEFLEDDILKIDA